METPPDTHTKFPKSYFFPNAGHIFHLGPGFLSSFLNDKDADACLGSPYHPFLSKGEWEIAKFLSCSGLSMKLVDEFLSLDLVSALELAGQHRN